MSSIVVGQRDIVLSRCGVKLVADPVLDAALAWLCETQTPSSVGVGTAP
jgi:hypothetical protein